MRKSKSVKRRKPSELKKLMCQNNNLETSKWAKYAPIDGPCTESVMVGQEVDRVLCYRCTSRSASGK